MKLPPIRKLFALACVVLVGCPILSSAARAQKVDSKSISLFNGKDLTGWHVDVPSQDENPNAKPTFIVRKGMLVSLGRPNGHLITDAKYENYRLEVEYRFAAKPGNCGVLVHASTPRALYKMFPKSIEVQMNHTHAGDFWCIVEDITVPDMVKRRGPKEKWGITEGKARRILNLTDGSEKQPGEWNSMTIECLKDEVKVWVNGDLVNHGAKCTATKGQLALQAEGSEVEFRKLELTPITKLTATEEKATDNKAAFKVIEVQQSGGFAGVDIHYRITPDGKFTRKFRRGMVTGTLTSKELNAFAKSVSAINWKTMPKKLRATNVADDFIYEMHFVIGKETYRITADGISAGKNTQLKPILMMLGKIQREPVDQK